MEQEEFPVGKGWWPIIREALDLIRKIDPETKITQIKEKFGGLRIYLSHSDTLNEKDYEVIHTLINQAEIEVHKTCEFCGSKDQVTTEGGWAKTLCHPCRKIKNEQSN